MNSDDYRKLVAANLTPEQIAVVMEMMDREARLHAEAEEARKAKGRDRVAKWREARNVTETQPKVTVPLTGGGDARGEVKTSNSDIEPVEKKDTPRAALMAILDETHAAAVVEHRQRIRKPLTAYAAAKLADKFAQCPDPNAAADKMIGNGWQGFEPEWMNRPDARGSPQQQRPLTAQQILKARRQEIASDDDRPPNRPVLIASR